MPDVLGVVPTLGRGSLVHEPLDGAPLFAAAVELLRGIAKPPVMVVTGPRQDPLREALARLSTIVDIAECPADQDRVRVRIESADVVIIHDPLCPLTPPAFVRTLLRTVPSAGALIGVRPVVDTVKATLDGAVAGTLNRDELRIVSSPIVVQGARLAAVPDLTGALRDPSVLVQALRAQGDVELITAPSASRRVEDRSGLRLMASVGALGQRVRER